MPLYDYKCGSCGKVESVFRKIADRDHLPNCQKCEMRMYRQISAARLSLEIQPYSCPITGKMITSRAEHRENLAKNGCRVLEAGETEQFFRTKQRQEEQEWAAVEETVEHLVKELPQEHKQRLAGELLHGAGDDGLFQRTTLGE